jgi:hypothetical protein
MSASCIVLAEQELFVGQVMGESQADYILPVEWNGPSELSCMALHYISASSAVSLYGVDGPPHTEVNELRLLCSKCSEVRYSRSRQVTPFRVSPILSREGSPLPLSPFRGCPAEAVVIDLPEVWTWIRFSEGNEYQWARRMILETLRAVGKNAWTFIEPS